MKAFSSMEERDVQAINRSILCFHTSAHGSTLIYLVHYCEVTFTFFTENFSVRLKPEKILYVSRPKVLASCMFYPSNVCITHANKEKKKKAM